MAATQQRFIDPSGMTVLVSYSVQVEASTAADVSRYQLSGDAGVATAALLPDGRTVSLVLDALALPGETDLRVEAGVLSSGGVASTEAVLLPLESTDDVEPMPLGILANTVPGVGGDTIALSFSDDMIPEDVQQVEGWIVESPIGQPLDLTGATVAYDGPTRTATLTLSASGVTPDLESFVSIAVAVMGMRDVGGNIVGDTTIGVDAPTSMVVGDLDPPQVLAAAADGTGDLILTFNEEVAQVETVDLVGVDPLQGTSIVLTDASDPGAPATGTIELTADVRDGDAVGISDGSTTETFEFDMGATGSVTLSGLPLDGDSVTIGDGVASVIFEFDLNALAIGTPVTIGLSAAATSANLRAAIDASVLSLDATADAAPETTLLRNPAGGSAGNVPISNFDLAGVQTLVGMTGGGAAGAGAISVPIEVGDPIMTAGSLRSAIDGSSLAITTSAGGSAAEFALENDTVGVSGNLPIAETDADGAITAMGLEGGIDAGMREYAPVSSGRIAGRPQARVTFPVPVAPGDAFELFGVTDPAGNDAVPMQGVAVVAEDAAELGFGGTAPVLEAIEGEDNDRIVIQFDRAVHPMSLGSTDAIAISDGAPVDLSGATFELTADDELTIELGPGANYDLDVTSTYTIEFDDMTTIQGVAQSAPVSMGGLSVSGDATEPTVGALGVALDPADANSVLITYSEAIDSSVADNPLLFTGPTQVGVSAELRSPDVLCVTFDAPIAALESVDIAAGALRDRAGNVPAMGVSRSAAVADAAPPLVSSIASENGTASGRDRLIVAFSEPMRTVPPIDLSSFTIAGLTGDALAGASIQYSSSGAEATIELAGDVRLETGDALTVTVDGLMDGAGNAMLPVPTPTVVVGDSDAPSGGLAFVCYREDANRRSVHVHLPERLRTALLADVLNWASSGGQTVVEVDVLTPSLVRLTLDGSLGPMDTVTLSGPIDLAGNVGAALVLDPQERP